MAQPSNHQTTEVTRRPTCDLCTIDNEVTLAYADARIPFLGSWGNVCKRHFILHGCKLGLGKGQRFVIRANHA